jgi:signal transduction histidine kinase
LCVENRRPGSVISVLCNAVVGGLVLCVLSEYIFQNELGLDLFFFKNSVSSVHSAFPGRASPHTSFTLLLWVIAFFFFRGNSKRTQTFGQNLAIVTFFLALLALIGHIYGVTGLFGISALVGMAIHTASSILLLSIGLLFLRPTQGVIALLVDPGVGGLFSRRLLLAALFMPLLTAVLVALPQRWGWFEPAFGSSLYVISTILSFAFLVLISAKKLAFAEERRLQLAVEESARRQAERAVKSRDEFLTIASHELKTPLTSLKLHNELRRRLLKKNRRVILASKKSRQCSKAMRDGSSA